MSDTDNYSICPIARIHTDFPDKFGIPRQCGLIPELRARIDFEPEFRVAEALRGLEGFERIWLIWSFSENRRDAGNWSPTVRPPRLGGSVRMGVWATRSPYRPNALALSNVELLEVHTEDPTEPYLIVGGADLMDGTPIYDIKPYVAYSDAWPEAKSGFANSSGKFVSVDFPEELLELVAEDKRTALIKVLEQDPRGAFEKKPGYVFGLNFADYDVRFVAEEGVLRVTDVVPRGAEKIK